MKKWQYYLSAVIGLLGALLALPPSSTHAQLNEHRTVSMLNRTARVRADGSWRIPNIPARNQRVRARATCVENGVTRSGQSSFVDFTPRATNAFDADVSLTTADPIPARLTLTAPSTTLPNAGATVQLTATATFPAGQTQNVTAATTGTSYTVSNRAIATVSADGLVTAASSGAVIVSALNEGVLAMLQLRIGGSSGDTDGDGIPDDVEVANGLNPNDPTDAAQDADNDGLTNKQELIDYNTNPRVADTDGDGVWDGLEIQTGSNPLDPGSRNLAQALTSIGVVPAEFTLTNNSLLSGASRQLTVLGQLRDGSTINLAKTSTGTTYTSSDNAVCGISGSRVVAGSDGTCTISVANSGFTAQAAGTVNSFSPVALSSIAIPGYANNVDVSGNFAYVAAGAAGLQVVNVSNPRNPQLVGALDTPGNANDVRVVGTLAYIADGVAGLHIIDVSNPYAPVLRGTFDTAGEAMDVRVIGTRAYVADGEAGLQIIDVSVATTPVLLGTIDTASIARGVDGSGTLAVVADGYTGPMQAGLVTIDVSNPTSPQLLTRFEVSSAVDVTLRGGLAYVAGGFLGNFEIVDISTPATPRLVAELPGFANFEPADLDLFSRFVVAADSFAQGKRTISTNKISKLEKSAVSGLF